MKIKNLQVEISLHIVKKPLDFLLKKWAGCGRLARYSIYFVVFIIAPALIYAAAVEKPYTFYPGKVASSDEINTNFDAVYEQVNYLDGEMTDLGQAFSDLSLSGGNVWELVGSDSHYYTNGNVGIGDGNYDPEYKLDVMSDLGLASGEHIIARMCRRPGSGENAGIAVGYYADSTNETGGFVRSTDTSIPLYLGTAGAPQAVTILDNGRVGIWKTDPGYALDANGTMRINYATGANSLLNFSYNGISTGSVGTTAGVDGDFLISATRAIGFYAAGGTMYALIGPEGGLNIGYSALNMYLIPENGLIVSGNVGIGTTSPTHQLTVAHASAPSFAVSNGNSLWGTTGYGMQVIPDFANGATYIDTHTYNAGSNIAALIFRGGHGGSEISTARSILTLNTDNGYVGIGTTSPSHNLDIHNSTSYADLRIQGVGDSANFALLNLTSDEATVKTWQITHRKEGGDINKLLINYNNGTTWASGVVTIDTLGNVGIGTTNPNPYKLYVNGNTYINGGAYCTSGSWSGSDLRYKKDITPLGHTLDKIMQLGGVAYNWKKDAFRDKGFDDNRHIGVIAQDVEKLFPELVSTASDGYKAVAYDKLTVVVLEAMKELKSQKDAEIEKLKNENSALTARLDRIEKSLAALERREGAR